MSAILAWILIGALIAAVAALGFRGARDSHIKKWEKTYGVTLDGDDEAVVERRLTHVRRARTLGAIVGFIGVSILRPGNSGDNPIWLQPLFGAGAGYLAAAVLTEITLRPLLRPPSAGASLVPRTFAAYLPRYAAVLLVAIPVVAVCLVPAYASLIRPTQDVDLRRWRRSSPWRQGSRRSLSSRRSASSPPSGGLSRSRELTCSLWTTRFAASLHALVGAALTLELLLLTSLFSFLQNVDSFHGGGRLNNLLALAASSHSRWRWRAGSSSDIRSRGMYAERSHRETCCDPQDRRGLAGSRLRTASRPGRIDGGRRCAADRP